VRYSTSLPQRDVAFVRCREYACIFFGSLFCVGLRWTRGVLDCNIFALALVGIFVAYYRAFQIDGIWCIATFFVAIVSLLYMSNTRIALLGTGNQARLGLISFGLPVEGLTPGMLLVSIHAGGPFRQTVLYVIEHSDNGSLAVILNSPIANREEVQAGKVLDLRSGGPVPRSGYVCIHNRPDIGSERIHRDGVFIDMHVRGAQTIARLAEDSDASIVFFRGISGWAPQQIHGEVRRHKWGWIPPEHVNAEDILETNPTRLKDLWTRLVDSPHLDIFEEQ
jgi:putative AlgH/UPF0301 family transcriptional regulator